MMALSGRHSSNIMQKAINYDTAWDAAESVLSLSKQLTATTKPPGSLEWEGLYRPSLNTQNIVQLQLEGISVETDLKPARENLEYDEVPMACIACSI